MNRRSFCTFKATVESWWEEPWRRTCMKIWMSMSTWFVPSDRSCPGRVQVNHSLNLKMLNKTSGICFHPEQHSSSVKVAFKWHILSIHSFGFWQLLRHTAEPENPSNMLRQRMPEWSPLRSIIACLSCHVFTLFLSLRSYCQRIKWCLLRHAKALSPNKSVTNRKSNHANAVSKWIEQ